MSPLFCYLQGGNNMTIAEAINSIDALKPNSYSESEKVAWLSKLDATIKKEVIDTHEGGEDIDFDGYDKYTMLDTDLIVKAPFDDIYPLWLESRIDYYNREYGAYNNSVTAFNTAYSSFERAYNRDHMPKGTKIKYF